MINRTPPRTRVIVCALILFFAASGYYWFFIRLGVTHAPASNWTIHDRTVISIDDHPSAEDIAPRLLDAIKNDSAYLALDEKQRHRYIEQASMLLSTYLRPTADEYIEMMAGWGGAIRENMIDEPEFKRQWMLAPASYPWARLAIRDAVCVPIKRTEKGAIIISPNTAEGMSSFGKTLFDFPLSGSDLIKLGNPSLFLLMPAESRDGQIIQVGFSFVWNSAEQQWIPYAMSEHANPGEGLPTNRMF